MKSLCQVLSILLLFLFASCSKSDISNEVQQEPSEPSDFRSKLLGHYEGIYYGFSQAPQTGGPNGMVMVKKDTSFAISIEVALDGDSSVYIKSFNPNFTKDLSIGLMDSASAFYQGPGGSSYWSESINFRNDSIIYKYFSKCGIPCSQGFDIKGVIKR